MTPRPFQWMGNDGSDFSIIPTMNSVRNGPTPVFPDRVRERAEVEMY